MRTGLLFLAMLVAAALAPAAPPAKAPASQPAAALKTYETRYYIILTDLDADSAREAGVRMTAMAEEYYQRTRGFSGVIRRKLPFYLFSKKDDYLAAGGPPNSTGVYNGRSLMAIAGDKTGEHIWHVVQHEGFHQFAYAVITGRLPTWLNEGMAEYFGESLFTGNDFVAGIVSPYRLGRLQTAIRDEKTEPFPQFMNMSGKEWSSDIAIGNYDQAWSMLHFLVHGDEGKYAGALSAFINDLAGGMGYDAAWGKSFGRDIAAFEKRWRDYWLEMPAHGSARRYQQATVSTLAGWLGRATSQKQTFASVEEFFTAAGEDALKHHPEDWLPPSILRNALGSARRIGQWRMEAAPGKLPQFICRTSDGAELAGAFGLNGQRVGKVTVTVAEPKPPGGSDTKPAGR